MNPLSPLLNEKYINLETFRKSGEPVRTPVWFVVYQDQLCFNTEKDSGKVKRIRRNPAVNVAPCKINGELTGDWATGVARAMQGAEIEGVKKVYSKKYGFMGVIFEFMGKFRRNQRQFYSITLSR